MILRAFIFLRKRLAMAMRKCANALDKPKPVQHPSPMDFIELIETDRLANEIRRRNDVCVIFWGRWKNGQHSVLDGFSIWQMHSSQFQVIMTQIANEIGDHLKKVLKIKIGSRVKVAADGHVLLDDSIGYVRKFKHNCESDRPSEYFVCDTSEGNFTWSAWVTVKEIELIEDDNETNHPN